MEKFISKSLVCIGTIIISYFMLMAYGFNWQWTLSLLAIFWIAYGVYMGENDHD